MTDSGGTHPANREMGDVGHGHRSISFIVAVNDWDEARQNLLDSPIRKREGHEWMLVDNVGNQAYDSISKLYFDAAEAAKHELLCFVHQDVFLPEAWESDLVKQLDELERSDPDWAVIGAVGVSPNENGAMERHLVGNWRDPRCDVRTNPLPKRVQSLDELWLGIRKSSGLRFDPSLPGFHCYGMDVALQARAVGLSCYAVDARVWHKRRDGAGNEIRRAEQSPKILRRSDPDFLEERASSIEYVSRKWARYRPFQSTSWSWT